MRERARAPFLASLPESARGSPPALLLPTSTPQTALLIAPEPAQALALRVAVQAAGLRRVLVAATASEALMLLGSELVDVVLTPWAPPEMEGAELLQALHDRGANRNVPVVLLDEGLPPALVVAAVKAGIAGKVSVPVAPQALRALLSDLPPRGGTAVERD